MPENDTSWKFISKRSASNAAYVQGCSEMVTVYYAIRKLNTERESIYVVYVGTNQIERLT